MQDSGIALITHTECKLYEAAAAVVSAAASGMKMFIGACIVVSSSVNVVVFIAVILTPPPPPPPTPRIIRTLGLMNVLQQHFARDSAVPALGASMYDVRIGGEGVWTCIFLQFEN